MTDNIKLKPGILAWLFTLLFSLSQIRLLRHEKFACPACGAPEKDLMPNSDLCFRCYYWALAILTSKRYRGKSGNLQSEEPVESTDNQADGIKE